MRSRRLSKEEIVTLTVLARKGESKCRTARLLGVSEGAVRYHLRRQACGEASGNAKPRKAEAFAEVIAHWIASREGQSRPVNVKELFEYLVFEHEYTGSYKSVLRHVRATLPKPAMRTYRRVETPPGAQSQLDWADFPGVRVGGEVVDLHAFIMSLSHSRKPAVIWSRRQDQHSWHHCHNESYLRLQGVAAVNRVDNVKTAIGRGAGAWGEVNAAYRAYAKAVGFHVDACQPRAANAKGKVEAKVRLSRYLVDPYSREWCDLSELQRMTDLRLERWAAHATCPATGKSVQQSWLEELPRLAPVPVLPQPFDCAVTRTVHRDCSVSFEGRSYSVPFRFVGRQVEVRGCPETVQILADGGVIQEHPRGTSARVLIDPRCYDSQPNEVIDGLLPPLPLGKMGARLQELMEMPVQTRPIDLYAALAEVAR